MGLTGSKAESINSPLILSDEGRGASSPLSRQSRHSRESAGGVFVKDLASEYTFCIVFPPDGEYLNDYCSNLTRMGMELFVYRAEVAEKGINIINSVKVKKEGNIFVLIRAPVDILRTYADANNVKMLLDEEELRKACERGFPPEIAPMEITDMPTVVKYRPFELIYTKFSTNKVDESLFHRSPGHAHPFQRDCLRLKIIATMIEAAPPGGGPNLKLKRYLRYQRILGFFALHDAEQLDRLDVLWRGSGLTGYLPWKFPVNEIKEYFGEKTAMYYLFMGHYNRWLCIPAFVGVPIQLGVLLYSRSSIYTGFTSAPFLPAYSLAVTLWAVFLLEFWKRREHRVAMEWGMSGLEEQDVVQPEFRGQIIKSFVDGKEYIHFPTETRNKYVLQSSLSILALTFVVIGAVASIYTIKAELQTAGGFSPSNAQTAASIINSLLIQLTNLGFTFVANALTSRENHRTQHDHDDSLIIKIYVFQFINSFASFYFLAFFAEYISDVNCGVNGCMYSLALNLFIIFIIRIISQQVVGIVIPWLMYTYKRQGGSVVDVFLQKGVSSKSRPENEFLLEPYDAGVAFIEDMMDSCIQFGYMSLFVTSLPVTALLALISNFITLRGKAWKLLNIHQRPAPVACEDIGQFQSILLVTAIAAVITNAALAVFTMTVFDHFSQALKFWVFIGFQWLCFSAQAVIMEAIPDEPESIVFHKKRAKFIEAKVIDRVEDDHIQIFENLTGPPIIQEYPLRGGYFQSSDQDARIPITATDATDVIPPSASKVLGIASPV